MSSLADTSPEADTKTAAAGPLQPGAAGIPRGVWLVAFVEMWERFSYWGILAILTLYLSAAVASGGFGWEPAQAIKLYGLYGGLAFAGPVIGGWIASSYWGERRCILVGGLLVMLGHVGLAGPGVLPWLSRRIEGVDHPSLWASSEIALGQWRLEPEALQRLSRSALEAGVDPETAVRLYYATGGSFLLGLLLVIAGTALLKPTISSIVGRFYARDDRRRDDAFGMFFVAIYVGCIVGALLVGYLGERVSWHWGFGAAAIGMAIGLVSYLWKQQAYLGDLGREKSPIGVWRTLRALQAEERDRLKVLGVQGLFAVLYAAAFYQIGGLLILFANERVDRRVGDWEIPASWMGQVATLVFMLVMPLMIRLWSRMAQRGRDPGATVKLAWGLGVMAAAYLLLGVVTPGEAAAADVRISWIWLALAFVLFGIGDTLVWPHQISLASRLAPPALSALLVGGWYITIGAGTAATGYIGALAQPWGTRTLFLALSATLAAAAVAAWALVPWLRRRMHGAGQG